MTVQIVVRVPDDDAEQVDRLIERGRYASRSEAVRDGLAVILDREARAAVGRAIVEGYARGRRRATTSSGPPPPPRPR